MSAIPKVLVPLPITDAMLSSSTVSEPSSSETAWVSGGAYALNDKRIRVSNHREYSCILAHTGSTVPPESDSIHWLDIGPTDKWAMFDNLCSTQTKSTSALTVVLRPGFFNAIALYNLYGSTVTVTVKDSPGGATIYSSTSYLDGPYFDEWDWCWGPFRQQNKFVIQNISPYPDPEVTVQIAESSGGAVGCGMLAIGDLRPLILTTNGGTEYGASAIPVDYSVIKTDEFGDTTITKRRNATDMSINVVVPQSDADYALSCVQSVLATPAAWIGADDTGYAGLNVFGLGSGRLVYENPAFSKIEINVKGLI